LAALENGEVHKEKVNSWFERMMVIPVALILLTCLLLLLHSQGQKVFSQGLTAAQHSADAVIGLAILIVRPDEGLFFANTDALRSEILQLVDEAQAPVQVVLLDLEMSNQLDVPSVDMLAEDGMKMVLDVIEKLRVHSSGNRRVVLETVRRSLFAALDTAESNYNKDDATALPPRSS
jgi:MFS superfamily sulfate permease-like transporter